MTVCSKTQNLLKNTIRTDEKQIDAKYYPDFF